MVFSLLAAGASLLGGTAGVIGSKKAAGSQKKFMKEGLQWQQPYAIHGKNYLGMLGATYGMEGVEETQEDALERYKSSPSYALLQDVINQTTENVKGAHAASGTLASGSFGKDLAGHLAPITLNDYYNYIKGMQTGALTGQNSANRMTQGLTDIGTVKASGIMGATNAIQGGIENALGSYAHYSGRNAGSAYPLQYDPSWSNMTIH